MVAVTHASNVTGTVQPIRRIAEICREKDITLLVDAAQSAGVIPIDCREIPIDFLAFSGHKGLLGPQGTGCLCLAESRSLKPLTYGGTGSLSDRDIQPDFLPDHLESGTLNTVGIAGLLEGIRYIQKRGVEEIHRRDNELFQLFRAKLREVPEVRMYGTENTGGSPNRTGVLSITVDSISPSTIGEILDNEYGISTRIGLHCAPRAHETIGTFPDGTVRFSWGPFTREREIMKAVDALKRIIRTEKHG
jgi:selenocysteine lyase/cysteine desulfurase